MKGRHLAIFDRIDALSLKERVLVLLATMLVLGVAWDAQLMQKLAREEANYNNSIESLTQQITAFEIQAGAVVEAAGKDPDAEVKRQITRLQRRQAQLEDEIRNKAARLVAPSQMAPVLRSVLDEFTALEFVALEGLGVESLLPQAAESNTKQDPEDVSQGAYRHGFRLTFNGTYHDVLSYLRALERLDVGFFWDSIEVEMTEYPIAAGSVVVFTLSLDEEWIGV